MIDYLLDMLDKPGRAVRGVLGGRPHEGLAAVPFSDSLGLTDPADAVSGADLLRKAGLSTGDEFGDAILGFGVNAATDPLTYLGGFAGRGLGRVAGGALEKAAAYRGPGYATGVDDLYRMAGGNRDATSVLDVLGGVSPGGLSRAASEVPPGSTVLGAGSEGLAFRTPGDQAVRLGRVLTDTPGRPVSEHVLQAARTADYGPPHLGNFNVRAEWSPVAEPIPTARVGGQMADVYDALKAEGLKFYDNHAGNLMSHQGRPVVIDPGAVRPVSYSGPYADVLTPENPPLVDRLLLDLLGGQPAMRRALEAGRPAPAYRSGLGLLGGLGGASLGLS